MSIEVRASVIITAEDDQAADAILVQIGRLHRPLNGPFVSVMETNREEVPE